ncbi:MAG: hypothetical protein IJ057_01520 [Bacteroidales bacterium]|nr:hypothetical protein [Bacteroidales bacterium]
MQKRSQIIVLWLMTMGGFACHTIMDLLPLFWNQSIAIDNSGTVPQPMLLMMATLSLLLPACGIFCLLPTQPKRWLLWVNTVIASIIGLFNIAHAFMELPSENAAQYIIMPLMIVIGVCLAWKSWQLLRVKTT